MIGRCAGIEGRRNAVVGGQRNAVVGRQLGPGLERGAHGAPAPAQPQLKPRRRTARTLITSSAAQAAGLVSLRANALR